MKNKIKSNIRHEFEHLGYDELVGGKGIKVGQGPTAEPNQNRQESTAHQHMNSTEKANEEKRLDNEIEQSFPASDPPSMTKPFHDEEDE